MRFVFPEGFDPRPTLKSDSLLLRPIAESDRDALAKAASDPAIWAGHPARDRYRKEVFATYFDTLLGIGGCLAILDQGSGAIIGCSAYYSDPNAPSRLSIGFTFLQCAYWGGSTNRELKRLMLDHLFNRTSEAWFHISPENVRSQAATRKLGAVLTHENEIDLGGGLQPWQCYCLSREAWTARAMTRHDG